MRMARRRSHTQRKKDREMGYQLVQPERLDVLFEYWDLHGLGLEAWKNQRGRKRER
jgi:hypothetical protein